MLKLPAYRHYDDCTVFQDDAQFYKFYIIPGVPRVRIDANGSPVFQLIKYSFSDDQRAADPKLGKGGGYLTFDTELAIDAVRQEEIKADLERDVEARWAEMKRAPDSRTRTIDFNAVFADPQIGAHWAQSGMATGPMATAVTGTGATITMPGAGGAPVPADAPAPPVLISEPLWTSGTVSLQAPQSPGLVVAASKEVKAALLGNNTAAFAMDLTADGAVFMQRTLVGEDGSGATDLTPLQVRYDLELLARLPPANVLIKFNTMDLFHSVHELYHEHDNCSDDYFTSETLTSQAVSAGLLTVHVDTGGITDETLVQTLFQQAMATAQNLLKERFTKKERAEPTDWGDEVAQSSDEVYRLKQVSEIDATNFEQIITLDTTTKHRIAPQGSLETFLRGKSAEEMKTHIREISLDDPFFHTLDLRVRAFARWVEDGITFVEVEVIYGQGDHMKTQSFTFTPGDTAMKTWDPFLVDDRRGYRFRWRYAFEGREAGEWSADERSTARDLNVSVESPGHLKVDVTGVGLDFQNILDAVLVHLKYEDQAHGVPLGAQSILLSKERGSGHWERRLYGPWALPVQYRVEFLLQTGTTIDSGWKKQDGPSENLVITRPNVDQLNLTLLPAGPGWDIAIQSVVTVRYADGDYHRDAQFAFKTNKEFREWAVLLLNPAVRGFEYQIVSTFTTGDVQQTAWLQAEGDQALPVKVEGPPRVKATISGVLVDYSSTPVVEVELKYTDPGNPSFSLSQSFSLQDSPTAKVQTFSTPRRVEGPRELRYRVTYFPLEGPPIQRDWMTETADMITIERYTVRKAGAEFVPTLIDFAVTPVVDVDVFYNDAQSGVSANKTLNFTDKTKQSWYVVIPDTAPRSFAVEITYYLESGDPVKTQRVMVEKTSLTIPRYKPAEG